ncbi:septum formation family protein [Corynebacterium aquatimens]|uniref:Septum formation-related domain-containing protein n=1 Tax=Corynebacterium aquatimens TaxID=1190508 RepID=A0A931E225_9CORY|nr:septum formation family protein [Corynebacterium aquatimens]MBG6122828.1 hypothetical protein [Corynebacterium aquatimens]
MAFKGSSISIRALLCAALVGAGGMGAYAGATGFELGAKDEAGTNHAAPTNAPKDEPIAPFTTADKGECLTWNVAPDGQISGFEKASCAGEHRFEVSSREDLSTYPIGEFGPDAPPPNPTRQAQLREELCQAQTKNYLEGRYDPAGRYSIAPILPPAQAWEKGDRTMLCGIQETDQNGAPILTTGRAAEQDQARVTPVGRCIITDEANTASEVECSEVHHIEITSIEDLAPVFPDRTPTVEQQDEYLQKRCTAAAEEFLGGEENLYQSTLQVYWGTSPQPAWDGGSRRVNCGLIFARDNRFAALKGSATAGREGFTIDGKPPAKQPERRPLRSEQRPQDPPPPAPEEGAAP